MGYETRTTWEPEEGDYIGYESLSFFRASEIGLKKIPPYMKVFLESAVFKLTDVYWGGRASPAAWANIGEFTFAADDPKDLRPYEGEDAEGLYYAGVETFKTLLAQAKEEEKQEEIAAEKKLLLELLNKHGIPEVYQYGESFQGLSRRKEDVSGVDENS